MRIRNKSRKIRRNKKGGTRAYTSSTNIASTAGSFSGITARPQVWVGGKNKTYRRRK
jgi:hypothetical protein